MFDFVGSVDGVDVCISDCGTCVFERHKHSENDNDSGPHNKHNNECNDCFRDVSKRCLSLESFGY